MGEGGPYVCTRTRTRAHMQARTRARIAQAHALSQQGVTTAAPGQPMHGDSQSDAWMPQKRIKTAIKGLLTRCLWHWCAQHEDGLVGPEISSVTFPPFSDVQAHRFLARSRQKIKTDSAHSLQSVGVSIPDSQVIGCKAKSPD